MVQKTMVRNNTRDINKTFKDVPAKLSGKCITSNVLPTGNAPQHLQGIGKLKAYNDVVKL